MLTSTKKLISGDLTDSITGSLKGRRSTNRHTSPSSKTHSVDKQRFGTQDETKTVNSPLFTELKLTASTGSVQSFDRKTLALDLDGTLVHTSIESKSRYHIPIKIQVEDDICTVFAMKRPGLDDFLSELSQHYNICIYTSAEREFVESVCEALGIMQYIWSLHTRECFIANNSEKVLKDVRKIGLVPSRTVLVDDSLKHVQNQPDNGILVKPFDGDPKDKELYNLFAFLKHLSNFTEVRPVVNNMFNYFQLEKFKNKDFELLNQNKQLLDELDVASEDYVPRSTNVKSLAGAMRALKSKLGKCMINAVKVKTPKIKLPTKNELIGQEIFDSMRGAEGEEVDREEDTVGTTSGRLIKPQKAGGKNFDNWKLHMGTSSIRLSE